MVLLVALTLLHGTVHIGPLTPVCRVGAPCDKPAPRVLLTFTHGATVRQVRTDSTGGYRLLLAPGTWSVRASTGMRIAPSTVTVQRVASERRDFTIDTGIR